jgi:DNA-binding CsgD family transcriptional regulator
MNDLILCNDLLVDLYQAAITVSPQLFHKTVLKHLDRVIGFDRAWWGIMSLEQTGFELHSSYRYELPNEFEEHWQAIKDDDTLAFDAHSKPRTTIHFNEKDLSSTPGLADLNTGHNIRHALCTSVFLPDQKSFLFISLFRSGVGAPAFGPEDVKLKQSLTPHLYGCWRTNLLSEIERTRIMNKTNDSATAFVDLKGMIIYADAAFGELLAREWPGWHGRRLPQKLLDMMASPRTTGVKRPLDLYVNQYKVGGLSRLDIRRPSPLDKLTNREREIAKGFSKALSYKEIAIETNLSPATVRHYLRVIYAKLEINDKAQLVSIVGKQDNYSFLIENPKLTQLYTDSSSDFDYLGNGAL